MIACKWMQANQFSSYYYTVRLDENSLDLKIWLSFFVFVSSKKSDVGYPIRQLFLSHNRRQLDSYNSSDPTRKASCRNKVQSNLEIENGNGLLFHDTTPYMNW